MRNYFLFVNAKCVADYTHKGNAEKAFHKYCEKYPDASIYVDSRYEGIIFDNNPE